MAILAILTLPDERPDKLEQASFDTTESAELYFKNVRSFYYYSKEEAEGVLYVYRLKSIFSDTVPTLPFALYNNWRTNETFIRLDSAYFHGKRFDAVIADSAGVVTDTIPFPKAYNESQYLFARDVFRAIEANRRLTVLFEENKSLVTESQVTSIKTTLKDYFKLLDKI